MLQKKIIISTFQIRKKKIQKFTLGALTSFYTILINYELHNPHKNRSCYLRISKEQSKCLPNQNAIIYLKKREKRKKN